MIKLLTWSAVTCFVYLGPVLVISFTMKGRLNGGRYNSLYWQRANALLKLRGGEDSLGLSEGAQSGESSAEDIKRAHEESLALYKAITECKDGYIAGKLQNAMTILSDALRVYGPEQLFSSYNGGKDAVVIMHLLRAVVAKYSEDKGEIYRPKFMYFAIKDEFPEVLEHIAETKKALALDLKSFDMGIVQGLDIHVKDMFNKGLEQPAFVLGTRRADPNCGAQEAFAPSSDWMPAFMRVNPILDWEYGHVWHFLRTFQLPYCDLYDRGYTSLGKVSDTRPNPALKRKSMTSLLNTPTFWPAYMLSDWSLERAGRGTATSIRPAPADTDTTTSTVHSDSAECAVDEKAQSLNQNQNDKDNKDGYFLYGQGKAQTQGLQEQAGLIVIGDEILNGFAQESNLLVCTNALAGVNVPLKRVSMIGDDIGEIVEEVQRMSQKYDYVITSGGIGPTHDDVTLKAIAKALDEEIEVSETMVAHLEAIYGVKRDKLDESTLRLAMLPQNSELLFPPKEESQVDVDGRPIWPVLRCDNIFVLPGVPQFFEDKMNLIAKHFIEPRKENYRPVVKRIVLDLEERSMVGTLDGVVDKFKDRVKIGSYPFIGHPDFKAILTVESLPVQGSNPAADADAVEEAVGLLIEQLPPTAVLRVEAMIPGEDNSLTKTKKVIRE